MIFGRQVITDDREHIRLKRASTLPVIYESHNPIMQCFDMSSDTMSIDDEEFERYANLQDDIDMRHVSENQSVILHDTLYVSCTQQNTYTEHAQSKDLVYNTGTALARSLNTKKFGHNYRHKHPVLHVYHSDSNARVDNDVSFVIESMRTSPVNMLDLARGTFGNVCTSRKSVSDVCNFLQNTSFTFRVDNHEETVCNVSSVSINVQRVLHDRNICGMCVSARFSYIPYIPVHNGTFKIIDHNCDTQANTYTTTQRMFIRPSRAPLIQAQVKHISEETIVLYTGLAAAGVAGIAIFAVLFKPIKHCVRVCLGLTPLRTTKATDIEDSEDNDDDTAVKMIAQAIDAEDNEDNLTTEMTVQVDIEDTKGNSDDLSVL